MFPYSGSPRGRENTHGGPHLQEASGLRSTDASLYAMFFFLVLDVTMTSTNDLSTTISSIIFQYMPLETPYISTSLSPVISVYKNSTVPVATTMAYPESSQRPETPMSTPDQEPYSLDISSSVQYIFDQDFIQDDDADTPGNESQDINATTGNEPRDINATTGDEPVVINGTTVDESQDIKTTTGDEHQDTNDTTVDEPQVITETTGDEPQDINTTDERKWIDT
ncbi:unnamed protein product [Mytilus coruscus]|uniref:Uncharacterized protein n=1 Tax=Mytilus coruscus TaxID=42192 RepID=A0A6J8E647_MYTCO|nr:unnamed protein product [Mytilus coruscus]